LLFWYLLLHNLNLSVSLHDRMIIILFWVKGGIKWLFSVQKLEVAPGGRVKPLPAWLQ
jgi:hypothetical protein